MRDYRAGDLERRYERLGVEEDAFVNYGFVPREMLALLHPRTAPPALGRGHHGPRSGAAGFRAGARRGSPP